MAVAQRGKRLSSRLFAAFLILSLSVLSLSATAVLATTWTEYEGEAERSLSDQADMLASLLSQHDSTSEEDIISAIGASDLRVTLVNENGDVTFDNKVDIDSMPNHADREEITAAQAEGNSVVLRRSETTGYDTLYAAVPIPGSTDVLRLAETRTSLPLYLTRIALPLVGIFLVALILSLVLSRLMASKITAPLVNIDVESPFSSETYDEISPLLGKIDLQNTELTEKNAALQDIIELRREFTGNVSHEMKSPLQVIGGYAELIQQGIVKDDDVQKFAGLIANESIKMRSLIDDVLTLSKLDEQQIGESEPVDLAVTCNSVMQRLAPSADDRKTAVSLHLPPSAIIAGSSAMAEQLVYNLIDNAIKYGREEGRVEVAISVNDEQVLLSVSDDGPGIPEELWERVFERFYRVDTSHSRDAGGTGLGMAIVKHAATSMGGKAWVTRSDLGGLKACASFPTVRYSSNSIKTASSATLSL